MSYTNTVEFYSMRPITVVATQWDGSRDDAYRIIEWAAASDCMITYNDAVIEEGEYEYGPYLLIDTNEDDLLACGADEWIVHDISTDGGFSSYKDSEFQRMYEQT